MLRSIPWLYLLALSFVACAAQAGAAESVQPENLPAIESADPAAGASSGLDLSFEPSVFPANKARRPAFRPAPDHSADETERRFSLGLNIRTRPEIGDEARESSDAPTLTEEVEGVVKRSTFGLTGTYRF